MLIIYLSRGYLLTMGLWIAVFFARFFMGCWPIGKPVGKRPPDVAGQPGPVAGHAACGGHGGRVGLCLFRRLQRHLQHHERLEAWLALHIDNERNNEGFRDRNPFNKLCRPGKKRIVFLGDSFTAGHGIKRIDDRFTDRIAAWLNEKRPGKYAVANLGEPGYEASMIEGLARALLFKKQADVSMIIYIYNINDIEGYDRPRRTACDKSTRPSRKFSLRDTYLLTGSIFATSSSALRGDELSCEPGRILPVGAVERAAGQAVELNRDCVEGHADFRMVLFPMMHGLGPDYPFLEAHRRLADFCKSEKIPVLDLEPDLPQARGRKPMVSRFDAHPNERAHAIAAEAIEKGFFPTWSDRPPTERRRLWEVSGSPGLEGRRRPPGSDSGCRWRLRWRSRRHWGFGAAAA